MLQDSIWTGLFFLAGIFCGSTLMGIAAIVSVITGTYTARLLNYDKEEIAGGLYGFSATLVGVALVCFFQSTLIIWAAILVGSMLATVIQHFFIVKKIPAYTFPFILVTWLALFIFSHFPALVRPQPAQVGIAVDNTFYCLSVLSLGFGQVIFQSSIWAGVLFFIGVLISKPIAALYAVAGAALSGIIAYWLGQPVVVIYLGLLSYNAVLCAITFAGKKLKDIIPALISIVLSVLIVIQMMDMGLPALTFPFVLATWLTLIMNKGIAAMQVKKPTQLEQ